MSAESERETRIRRIDPRLQAGRLDTAGIPVGRREQVGEGRRHQ